MFQLPAWFAGFHCYCTTSQSNIYIFFSYWAAFKLLGGHPDAGTATQTCSQWSDTCGAEKLANRYEGRVLTSSAAVKSPLPSSSSSVDQTNRAFVTFQDRTDTCPCVCEPDMFTLKDIVLELCRAKAGLLDCSDLSLVEEPSWGGQSIALSGLKHFLFFP